MTPSCPPSYPALTPVGLWKAKVNIPLCLAALLFCLTLLSSHFTGGLYARYISRDSGEDSARVIRFGDLTLTETGDFKDGEAYIIPGVNLTKDATVTFAGSESATYVFVEVEADGWTISGSDKRDFSYGTNLLSWNVAEGWNYLSSDGSSYVYYRMLVPNEPLNADIIANNGQISVSADITKQHLATMTDITIDLRAAVVQVGGFDSVGAAWASVSAH